MDVKLNYRAFAIQTLQRGERGKEDGKYVGRLVWGKYPDEPQGGNDLAGLSFGGKIIESQPQSI